MKLFDVNASCHEINGTGSDGAYSLCLRAVPAEEIGAELVKTLADFGLSNSDGPFRLELHIAEAGQGDNLPL